MTACPPDAPPPPAPTASTADAGAGAPAVAAAAPQPRRLLPGRRWPATAPKAAGTVIALHETSAAGLLSLLTGVLLHASPSCTVADASPRQLPDNFVEAAALVLEVLTNVCRLDLLAAQQLLAGAHNRLEFFHLVAFLLSYCSEQWPRGARGAGGAGGGAGGGRGGAAPRAGAARGAAPAGGRGAPAARGRAAAPITRTPRAAPKIAAAAAAAEAAAAEAAAAELEASLLPSASQRHPLAALMDELVLLLGYFGVANPSNQVGNAFGAWGMWSQQPHTHGALRKAGAL